jgi:hypothetical protein
MGAWSTAHSKPNIRARERQDMGICRNTTAASNSQCIREPLNAGILSECFTSTSAIKARFGWRGYGGRGVTHKSHYHVPLSHLSEDRFH